MSDGPPEELAEAAQLYRAALAVQPENGWVRFLLARILEKSGSRERALEQYRGALDLEPENPEFRYRYAEVLYRLRRLEESRAEFEPLAKLEKPLWLVLWSRHYLAQLALLRGDLAAVPDLARSAWEVRFQDNWTGAVYTLLPFFRLSLITGDEAPTLEARELLRQWSPQGAEPRARLAWSIVRYAGRIEQTEPPDAPPTEAGLRIALRHGAELARAAVEFAPAEPSYWNTLGLALYCAGDPDGAVQALRRESALLGESEPINQLCLALAEHARGNPEVALERYARAVDWMASHETDERQRWYRAEAARVLGL